MDPNTGERPGVEPLYYFAILSLMLLWIQGERQEVPQQNPNMRTQTIWDSLLLFRNQGIVTFLHLTPQCASPTITTFSPKDFLYTIQPKLTFNTDLESPLNGATHFQLLSHENFSSKQAWLTSQHSSAELDQSNYSEVISVIPDLLLYKNLRLPGCSIKSTEQGSQLCYLSLIRLPKEKCFESRKGCLNQMNEDSDSSWTCRGNPNVDGQSQNKNYCIELVSSSSIEGIYKYAKARKNSDPLMDVNQCLHDKDGYEVIVAGKIISFCADPLFHSLALDVEKHKLFFTQATSFNEKYKSPETAQGTPNEIEGLANSLGPNTSIPSNLRILVDQKFSTGFFENFDYESISEKISDPDLSDLRFLQENSTHFDLSESNMGSHIFSRACVSAINLDSNYMDLTPCVNLLQVADASLPIHLIYEEVSKKLIALSFDTNKALHLSVFNKDTLEVQYSLRFNHFHSGWVLTQRDDTNGYLIIIRDGDMLSHTIHALNLTKAKISTSYPSLSP